MMMYLQRRMINFVDISIYHILFSSSSSIKLIRWYLYMHVHVRDSIIYYYEKIDIHVFFCLA
jgi:hypothetical protein